MPTFLLAPLPSNNQLLLALNREEYARLVPYLKRQQLAQGKVLYEADDPIDYAYFLLSGAVSLLATTAGGRAIEVAEIGNEGLVGLPGLLGTYRTPYRVVVQMKGTAMRMRIEALRREFSRGGRLQTLLLSYTHARLAQVSQALVCNHFHTVEQRLSRWLLRVQDRVHSNRLQLTQQHIAEILGTSRTNVTMCAGVLQHNNFIRCTRGQITIIDQQGLELSACECYRELKHKGGTFLAA
jgi:CRP-like cAMP-binding protein